jgi:hypothetical protein
MKALTHVGRRMNNPSHSDRDILVRSVLAERGDDGRTPRHTLFFFYGGDIAGLSAAAVHARYDVHRTAKVGGVVLETAIAVDEESFAAHSQRMVNWAEEFGCEYDGWECQLVNN